MSAGEKTVLSVGDGRRWHFVNAAWRDGDERELQVPEEHRRRDGYSIQGHHYAFALDRCYQDVRVRFQFRLTPHSDIGIILRARNERCFYVFHLPDCGQASRAQHFWAALSKMDDSGFLRRIKLDLVRRVPSVPREWMTAELHLQGRRLVARIAGQGQFEAEDDTYPGAGRLGVYVTGNARIRDVVVEGSPAFCPPWDTSVRQPVNWFHPVPQERIWQKPQDLLRLPTGEVLLCYTLQAGAGSTTDEQGSHLAVRSDDGGCTWSQPEAVQVTRGPVQAWWPPRLHVTPAGRVIALLRGDGGYAVAESVDGARTWSVPAPTNIPLGAPMVEKLHLGPQALLNLADGSMVLFLYGGYALGELHGDWTWGSAHFQAFALRSTDDGRTWSDPVNVDDQGLTREGKQIRGNLDLTEVCAAQISSGSIMALIRPIFSPWMWETWSHDNGLTWGPCVCGPFPGYATPNMLRTASGAVLVAHRLPSLSINASWDEGRTWEQGVLIDSGLWCMGAMLEVEPDVVLYVYWDSFESLMRAQRLRITPGRLEPVPLPGGAPAAG